MTFILSFISKKDRYMSKNSSKNTDGAPFSRARARMRLAAASLVACAICAIVGVAISLPNTTPSPLPAPTSTQSAPSAWPDEATEGRTTTDASKPDAENADQGAGEDDASAYEPGFMLALLARGASVDEAAQALAALPELSAISVAETINDLVRFKLPEGVPVERATELAAAVDAIEIAQPNYRYYPAASPVSTQAANNALAQTQATRSAALMGSSLESALSAQSTPDDPLYDDQWYLESIHASEAWDILESTGSTPTTVAVIDSGFLVNHEDLTDNVVATYDATTKQNDIQPDNSRASQVTHGTHCAGTISATTNNGIGTAGLTNNLCKMVFVRVEDKNDSIYSSYIAQAYTYLLNKKDEYNIRVANLSLGAPSKTIANRATDAILYDCMKKGHDAGIVNVVAACNDDTDVPYFAYPSDFDSIVSVIALARTTSNTDGLQRASYSNYNKGSQIAKNISAPGSSILNASATTTAGWGKYASLDGTSMAAPVVTGVVGLMLAASPELNANEAISKLYSSASDLTESKGAAAGWDKATGFGEVDAQAAVSLEQPYLSGAVKVTAGKTRTYAVKIAGEKQAASSWQWTSSNTALATVDANGTVSAKKGGRVIISATKGSLKAQQVITVQVPASTLTVSLPQKKITYTGTARKPKVTITYNGKKLKEGHDYTISYKNNVNAGKARVIVRGIAPYYTGTAKKTFTIAKRPISKANIKLSAKVLAYNGKVRKPMVKIYDIGKNKKVKLKQNVHYKVTGKGVVSGRGKLTITARKACANFTGSVVKTFRVR